MSIDRERFETRIAVHFTAYGVDETIAGGKTKLAAVATAVSFEALALASLKMAFAVSATN